MLGFFEDILWLLVLIGVMINIHELGHFWAARYFDVKVEAFSFGFGTRLFGFRRGETDYRFSLIPLGGYVKMAGEQADRRQHRRPAQLSLPKPRWQRLIIAFAGPFMNIVLAVGVLTGLYMVKYQKVSDADMQAIIGHVMPDSRGGQSRNSGRRPHRRARRQEESHLGRCGAEGSRPAPTGRCTSRSSATASGSTPP